MSGNDLRLRGRKVNLHIMNELTAQGKKETADLVQHRNDGETLFSCNVKNGY